MEEKKSWKGKKETTIQTPRTNKSGIQINPGIRYLDTYQL